VPRSEFEAQLSVARTSLVADSGRTRGHAEVSGGYARRRVHAVGLGTISRVGAGRLHSPDALAKTFRAPKVGARVPSDAVDAEAGQDGSNHRSAGGSEVAHA